MQAPTSPPTIVHRQNLAQGGKGSATLGRCIPARKVLRRRAAKPRSQETRIDGGTGGGGGPPDIGDGPERHGAASRQGAGPLGGKDGKRGGAAIDRQQDEQEEMRRVDAAAAFARPAGDGDRMPRPDQQQAESQRHPSPCLGRTAGPVQEPAGHQRHQQTGGEHRHQDQPVQQQIADIEGNRRPGIGRQQAKPRRQVVAVSPDAADLGRLLRRIGPPRGQALDHGLVVRRMTPPGGQPAADIAPARYRREIVELQEQTMPGQTLEDAEAEGGATDAATREAESRPRLLTRSLEPMDALVERDERTVVDRRPVVQFLELLAQHGEQRGGHLRKLAGLRPARLHGRGCRRRH